ncbi:unnamed protein product [Brassicogethes aeneus]|uniref:Uncharacterized protein n=1 Tax=Brassicogethes aeneus TaxID=1431903 RepID=A0A9P0FJW0_BRAAE|nr:unnamed protein product [Brassicogethes aeneus]
MLRSEKITNILNYTENIENKRGRKVSISVFFIIGVVEFLLSSIFYSYSAFFLEFVDDGFYDYHQGFGVIIIFVGTKNISGALTKSICDYYEKNTLSRVFIVSSTIILCLSLLTSSFVEGFEYHLLLYGIIPAFISGCLTTYIKHMQEEEYDFDPNLYDSILLVSKALGLFCMPVVLIFVSDCYGTSRAICLFASLVLNVIPFSLFLKTKTNHCVKVNSNYYSLTNPQPMTEMAVLNDNKNEALILSSSSSSSGDYEEPSNDFWAEEVQEEENRDDGAPANVVMLNPIQDYYKLFGVNILPRIREESESSSTNEISVKRLSQITAKLEEINKSDRRNSVEVPQINLRQPTEEPRIPYYTNEIMFLQDNQGCCTPYESYLWKRRWRILLQFFTHNFFIPLFKSLTNLNYYPPLITKVLTSFLSSWFIISAPYLALVKSEILQKKFTTLDSIFLSSYIAFAWCFFLMSLPAITKQSHLRTKIIYIIGSAILALSMLFSTKRLTNDAITLSCLFFGFGYGMTSYSENIVFKDFLGSTHWQDCRGPLEALSGILMIVIYYVIDHYRVDYETLILYSFLIYFMNICTWIIAPLLKILIKYLKRSFMYRQQENLF